MGKWFKIVFGFVVIVGLSVLLTPPIHAILHPYFKFEKIFNRLVMVFTIAAAALYVRYTKKGKGGVFAPQVWRDYGFDFSVSWKKLFLYGFLTGAFMVAALAVIEIMFGPRYIREPLMLQDVIERFFKGMLSGMIVGIVEEFFFRGFVYLNIRRWSGTFSGILIASAFYSACHFFDNGQIFIPQNPSVKDAIRLLFGYLEPFLKRPGDIMPEFIGLFLFGILLNIAFARTKNLFLSIGVHAGTVFAIKFQPSFVRGGPDDLIHPIFAAQVYYDGWGEWAVLALVGVILFWFAPRVNTLKGAR